MNLTKEEKKRLSMELKPLIEKLSGDVARKIVNAMAKVNMSDDDEILVTIDFCLKAHEIQRLLQCIRQTA